MSPSLSQVTAEPAAGTSMTSTLKPDGSTDVYGACVVMGPGDVRPHSCHVLVSWAPSSDNASHAAQIEQAHMADEWVDTSQLHKMKGILEQWFQLA